jgi:hypothetical protein
MPIEDQLLDIILGIDRKRLKGSVSKDFMPARFKSRLDKIKG